MAGMDLAKMELLLEYKSTLKGQVIFYPFAVPKKNEVFIRDLVTFTKEIVNGNLHFLCIWLHFSLLHEGHEKTKSRWLFFRKA